MKIEIIFHSNAEKHKKQGKNTEKSIQRQTDSDLGT